MERVKSVSPSSQQVKPVCILDPDEMRAEWSKLLAESSDDESSPTPVTVIYRGFGNEDITDATLSLTRMTLNKVDEFPIPKEWDSPSAQTQRKVRRISTPPTQLEDLPSPSSSMTHKEDVEMTFEETGNPANVEDDFVSEDDTPTGILDKGMIGDGGNLGSPQSDSESFSLSKRGEATTSSRKRMYRATSSPALLAQWNIYKDLSSSDSEVGLALDSPTLELQRKRRRTSRSSTRIVSQKDHPRTPPWNRKLVYQTTSKTDINPLVVGPAAILDALRENAGLDADLLQFKVNNDSYFSEHCSCNVKKHPRHWSQNTIRSIHSYSFLLDCKDIEINQKDIVAANPKETILIYDVPMVDGHPWKKKAEQVLRYIDVEIGIGDQTVYDTLYYQQPCNRKIYLVLAADRVQGLVMAEGVSQAHRILSESECYQELEEEPVPVRLGINMIWTHVSLRRQHLATKLCDLLGMKFFKGRFLRKEEYAFNDLTESGAAFAKKYLKTFKVPLYAGKTRYKR